VVSFTALSPKFGKTLGYADAAFISLHKSVRKALEIEHW
jgi:hypothetical protein